MYNIFCVMCLGLHILLVSVRKAISCSVVVGFEWIHHRKLFDNVYSSNRCLAEDCQTNRRVNFQSNDSACLPRAAFKFMETEVAGYTISEHDERGRHKLTYFSSQKVRTP